MPGTAVVEPSVLLMARSDDNVIAVDVLELLLAGIGSGVGDVDEAVLPIVPAGVAGSTVAVMTTT